MTDSEEDTMPPRLLTADQAARLLAISRSKLYELMRAGRLDTIKIDGARRVPVDAVDDFIARSRTDAA